MCSSQSLQRVRTPLVQTLALPAFKYDFHLFVRSFYDGYYDGFVGTLKGVVTPRGTCRQYSYLVSPDFLEVALFPKFP